MGDLLIGVDVGQKRDPSAICVVESHERTTRGDAETHFMVRYLERIALGSSFLDLAHRLQNVVLKVLFKTRARAAVYVYVDITFRGEPLFELIEKHAIGAEVRAVRFTHGDERIDQHQKITLGKAWLVARLQTLLQTGRLHLAKSPGAELLARELREFEVKPDPNANDRYGAFKVGTRDELVTALGLAVQIDHQPRAGVGRVHAWG